MKAKNEGQRNFLGLATGVLWRSSRLPPGPLLFNVFINDLNFSVQLSSLRLYADDTIAYSSNTDISALELSLNKHLENLSSWFASNYLSVNSKKTQATILGKHSHEPAIHIGDSVIEIIGLLNILGVCIDDKLSFKDHLSTVLRNVYAKVGALRRLRKLVHADISLMYMAYILPHLYNCSPLLNKKLESANYYALKALLNFGNSLDYDSILSAVNMQSLKHRRYYQSLVLLFKCIKGNGPDYISDLFQPRILRYNLKNSDHNLTHFASYNNRYYHNSFTYKAAFMESASFLH